MPIVSLILCMESYGAPISIVLIPAFEAIIGPIVLPQSPSCLIMKSWMGTLHLRANSLRRAELQVSVIYL